MSGSYTNLEIPPAPQVIAPNEPPPKRSGCVKYAALGCGGLLLAVVLFVAAIFFFVFSMMKGSDPYKEAVRRSQHDARVVAKLGAPVETGWFTGGNISTTAGGSGHAELTIPLHGSKGKGSLRVEATKTNGTWTYQVMRFRADDGTEYDLAAPAIEREY